MSDAPALERIVESLLFLAPEPVSTPELAEACDVTEAEIDRALDPANYLGSAAAFVDRALKAHEERR